MKETKKIYKRNVDGSIQCWFKTYNESGHASNSQKLKETPFGIQEGKINTSKLKTVKAKNVGRSNETSIDEQIQSEIQSEYDKKLRTGYTYDIEEIDNLNINLPMLAAKYSDIVEKTNPDEVVFSSAKLNGIRGIITKDSIKSRENVEIISCNHVRESLKSFFESYPDVVLDGELYCHDLNQELNEIMSIVSKTTNLTEENIQKSKEKITYYVYDVFMNEPYEDRYKFLLNEISDHFEHVEVVLCNKITFKDANQSLINYLAEGYEGQMLRFLDTPYERDKRSKSLVKHKLTQSEEFEIVDILEGEGNREGIAGTVVCKKTNGETFGAGVKGTWEYAKDLLFNKEKYIGGIATIEFFDYTPYGIPQFPVAVVLFEKERKY